MSAEKLNLRQRQDRVQGGANVRWPGTGFFGCKRSNFSIVTVSSPTPKSGQCGITKLITNMLKGDFFIRNTSWAYLKNPWSKAVGQL